MILYIENPKDSTEKLLDIKNEISKVAGYKINTHKSMAFLYINNELSERETKKNQSHLLLQQKKIRYLGVNLTKGKGQYSENYRTQRKEIEEDTNQCKHILCTWTERINIIKMFILPKGIYRFNAIPIEIPMAYFTDIEQIFQKLNGTRNPPK